MKNKNTQKAFTIVETLITLLAITIMIAGPLTFMYRSYTYAGFVSTKIISTGLAQEGLELTTSLRNNSLAEFKNMATACNSGCMVDWDGESATPNYTPCTDESCKLYKSSTDATQMYSKTGDIETGQYRYVKISANGTGGYLVESNAWSYVDATKIEAKLTKMMFDIQIK